MLNIIFLHVSVHRNDDESDLFLGADATGRARGENWNQISAVADEGLTAIAQYDYEVSLHREKRAFLHRRRTCRGHHTSRCNIVVWHECGWHSEWLFLRALYHSR